MEKYPNIYKDDAVPSSVPHKQLRALELYTNYQTTSQISAILEVAFNTVRDWIYVGRNGMRPFKEIRGELEKDILKEIASNKMPALKSIMDSSLCIVRDNLEKLKKSNAEFTVDELKKVSDIASNLDKILRLDEGKATDNVQIANINPIQRASEIKEILSEVDDFGIFDLEVDEKSDN